jgi:hypothetical protein
VIKLQETPVESIRFKLSQSIGGMFVNRLDQLPVSVKVSEKLAFVFWNRSEFPDNPMKAELILDSIVEKQVSQPLLGMFYSLEQGKVPLDNPPQIEIPYSHPDFATVDEDGKISVSHGNTLEIFPERFRDIHKQVERELSDASDQLVRIIRWRQCSAMNHRPFAYVSYEWSRDGKTWHSMPHNYQLKISSVRNTYLENEAIAAIVELFSSGSAEPTYHEILREAAHISNNASRSALLLAVTALEAGLKSYITAILPNADIILENVQSPPVEKMANDLLPTLHKALGIESNFFPLKPSDRDFLRKMIFQRNQIVHGAKRTAKVAPFIDFVRRVLYQLDALQGQIWADENIHGEGSILVQGLPLQTSDSV